MKPIVIINRFRITNNYSLGQCYIKFPDGKIIHVGCSLERGWKNNQARISCIPEGIYDLVLEYSSKFKKDLWEVYGVPGRSECKFHAANYWYQLNGCIALGNKHKDINNDNALDVTSSRPTMKIFHDLLSKWKKVILEVNNI
jgi:hypothetical protein